ncbi:hypothetical protein GF354_06035 [Candidatus Peregrinibacteria bacterium]|nr:hypothetical protein [Candidatus Peregrinibacteria bacterium]
MKDTKKIFVWASLMALSVNFFMLRANSVLAYSQGDVVINEIAWAGSMDSSSDEWIELYNNSLETVDLSGWCIDDDNGSANYCIEAGVIEPRSYFLIEDSEESVSNYTADSLIGLSLANTGDSLTLKDSSGTIIDSVNSSGGAWYSGNSDLKASMERIDPAVSVDSEANWADAVDSNGSLSSLGTSILGTPGSINSVFSGSGAEILINANPTFVNTGDNLNVAVDINNAIDLYAYGFEISYDPTVLSFNSATEGGFLSGDGEQTFFSAAKENDQEGKIIVGASRLVNPESGIDGSGNLFNLNFNVIALSEGSYSLDFSGQNFISDSFGDVPAVYNSGTFSIGTPVSDSVTNLSVALGVENMSLELQWDAPVSGADHYLINRKNVNGIYENIGQTSEINFVDTSSLIPGIEYFYQVVAVKDSVSSDPALISGSDGRGIRGDNDRSGRVDGKDIERLARAYGSVIGDAEYNAELDTTYDGLLDGNDLIDIGANFGLIY